MKKLIVLLTIAFLSNIANAHITTSQEFTAINRIVGLCENCGENINLLVFYNPHSQQSLVELKQIYEYAKQNSIYKIERTYDLNFDTSAYNLVFLANGVDIEQMQDVVEKLNSKTVITASTDTYCIDKDACLLGVDVSDSIRIFLNENVLENTKVKFNDDVFLLTN